MASNRQNMAIVTIGSVPLIMTLGNSMLIPVLPAMQKSLDISSLQVSLTISVYSVAAALFIPILGYLSDRFTRKTILLPSLILSSLGALLAAFAASSFESYSWILVGRVIQGIGAAGTAPVAMALAGDLFKGSKQSRVLGIVEASNGLGKVLSPIFGSLLGLLVWYAVLYSFPIICLISIVLTWIFIKENDFKKRPPLFKNYMYGLLSVFKKEGRWLLVCYFVGGVCLFTLFGILFFLSDILEDFHHIGGVMKGLILAIPLLFLVSTSYITGSKMGKSLERMKLLILTGFLIMTLSYIGLIFINPLPLFLFVLALSSVGAGLVLPCINSLITGSVGKERRGFVTSLYSSIRFVGVAAGPPIFARLMVWSKDGMFLVIGILTLLTGLLVLFFIKVKGMDGKDNKKTAFRYTYL